MKIPSQLKPKNIAQTVKQKVDTRVKQKVQDFKKATKQKLEGELAKKLSTEKIADRFNKLSNELDLKRANNAISVAQRGDTELLGQIQTLPPNDVPANSTELSAPTTNYKVRLVAYPQLGGEAGDEVVFDVMPSISESQSAQYDTVDIIHHPGAILKYKGTAAREWQITADFVSRTVEEATENLRRLNLIRSWVMPFYGVGTGTAYPDQLGGPPQILKFYGFGPKMIGEASVVLSNFSWTFEPEIDYIFAGDSLENRTPFPVHIRVQLSLSETWSPKQFTQFNLKDYREGNMPTAFGGAISNRPNISTTADASRINTSEPVSASALSTITANLQAARESAGSLFSRPGSILPVGIRSIGPI